MFRSRVIWNVLKASALALFLYNELFSYLLLPFQWPARIKCPSAPGTCVNVLLVADPQILGDQDSSGIAKWDCDRYLTRNFGYALDFVLPDIVIFLGDEMDEGHISSDSQFKSDFTRFRRIFSLPEHLSSSLTIYLPGDNDIGGEDDPILPHVVHRFDKHFDQSVEPVTYQFLEFYKVNKMTSMFQEPDVVNSDVVRVALSHMPLLRRIHTLSKRVATSIKPHLIFSGHDHSSVHVTAPLSDVWRKKSEPIDPTSRIWRHYTMSDSYTHEFVVPTCSYRMGVQNMGFGVAHIDLNTKTVSYNVLWLPQRLAHLLLYLGFLVVTAIVFVCTLLVNIKYRVQRLCRRLSARARIKRPTEIP